MVGSGTREERNDLEKASDIDLLVVQSIHYEKSNCFLP